MEKSVRWIVVKEIEKFGLNGISNLLNYGDFDEMNIIYFLFIGVYFFKIF